MVLSLDQDKLKHTRLLQLSHFNARSNIDVFNAALPTLILEDGIEHVYIAVMGITGSGKSSFVCICSEQDARVGCTLKSGQSTHLPCSKSDD